MKIRAFRRSSLRPLAAVVTAALLATAGMPAWAAPAASARPATALEVQSEPAGAAVYVDGQWKGATPVAVEGIAAGDHTVRVVKAGFLENSRVVAVPASGRSLRVALTATGVQPKAERMTQGTAAAAPEGGEGGSRKKWLWIGVGAAALTGIGVGVYLATKNDPPKVSGVTASPLTALQEATSVEFAATASDPDGDSLSYTWNFADGSTGTGASVSHVFPSAGTYTVSVEVSDGKDKVTGTTSVTVKSMGGGWTGAIQSGGVSLPISMNLSQNGSGVGGTYAANYPGYGAVSGTVAGNVRAPANVTLTVSASKGTTVFYPLIFNGTFGSTLDGVSGTVTENGVPFSFTLSR